MGGAVSVSEKSSVCKERVKLAILAIQQQKELAKAQKEYNDLQNEMATPIKNFVEEYYSLSSHSVKLQDTIFDEEKKGHHEEKDSSIVTEKAETSRNEDFKTTKEKSGKSNKKRDTKMVAEKVETSLKKEDNVGHRPETPEKDLLDALTQVKDQFDKVCKSGSGVCELLKTESVQVENVKEQKNKLVRSFTWSHSTKSKFVARSRSVKVGDNCMEKAEEQSSILKKLLAWEEQLSREVEIVEDKRKIGGTLEVQVAEESALEAFNRIKKLRDDELQPQLSNLLQGLQKIWTNMSHCHDKQNEIMSENFSLYKPHVKCCDAKISVATDNLQKKLQKWCAAFTSYICSQKAFIKSLNNWSKYSIPSFFEKEVHDNGCTKLLGDWLTCLEKLEDKEVSKAISECDKEVQKLVEQQKKERECKSKVEKLDVDICKLVQQYKKIRPEKKEEELNRLMNTLKNEEKAYQTSKTNTQKIVTNVIQERFASVFKSLAEFTTKAAKEYAEVAKNHNINCSD